MGSGTRKAYDVGHSEAGMPCTGTKTMGSLDP